jgi:hypothetical protein
MSVKRRTFIFVVLTLLLWALVASLISAYYYYSYNDLFQKTRKQIIHINLGFDYGNGTIQWFNQTEARSGDTMLDVTMHLADVNYSSSVSGAFVNSINNVENTLIRSWIWWTWSELGGWDLKLFASDKYILGDNETAYWYYEDVTMWPPQAPT